MNYLRLISFIILCLLAMSGCMGTFKIMTPDGEDLVKDRSGKPCRKLYEGYKDNDKYAVYGDSCQVEVIKKLKDLD